MFVPTRSSWCSSVLNSANCAFELQLSLEWSFGDGSGKFSLSEGNHFLQHFSCCWGFVVTSFLIYYPWFLLDCSCFEITVNEMPQFFISLLRRFWLSGLFFWEIMTTYLIGNQSPFFGSKGMFLMSFFVYWTCVWTNWETTLPQVLIKGFKLCKK